MSNTQKIIIINIICLISLKITWLYWQKIKSTHMVTNTKKLTGVSVGDFIDFIWI